MQTLDIHTDREGFVHIECQPECSKGHSRTHEVDRMMQSCGLVRIVDFNEKVDEVTGFEFWHIKGV
jgi:hypothetical protein